MTTCSLRALKWAPTWYVSADTWDPFYGQPLDQVWIWCESWSVSPDISSGGSFQSSQWTCSHGTLKNDWEFFVRFQFPCRTVYTTSLLALLNRAKWRVTPTLWVTLELTNIRLNHLVMQCLHGSYFSGALSECDLKQTLTWVAFCRFFDTARASRNRLSSSAPPGWPGWKKKK